MTVLLLNATFQVETVCCAYYYLLAKQICMFSAEKEFRLRVVDNFGDRDCGADEIHTRARAKFRGHVTRRERQKLEEIKLTQKKKVLIQRRLVHGSHLSN